LWVSAAAARNRLVDEIVWVKLTVNKRIFKSHGYYLQHAKEVCLVARKNPTQAELQQQQQQQQQGPAATAAAAAAAAGGRGGARAKAPAGGVQQQPVPGGSGSGSGGRFSGSGGVGSDIIFSERRGQSQKPEEIYHLIEELVPNGERGGGWVCACRHGVTPPVRGGCYSG
jgi:mRNA (2'-O-methyladenosine-N6-)-methyltransferase